MTDSPERPAASVIPLIAILCAAAGAIDVIAYLSLGKIFVGNMTGNTVLFAASLVARDWREAGLRIGVVIAFVAGILLANIVLRDLMSRNERRTRLATLAIEFALLCGLASASSHAHTLRILLLVLLAMALGAQNDAFRNIAGLRVFTVHITGDLTNLGAAIANSESPGKNKPARRKVAIFFTTWIAYASGALIGAAGALNFAAKAMWIPACLVAAAAAIVIRSPNAPPKAALSQRGNPAR